MTSVVPLMRIENVKGKVRMWRKRSSVWGRLKLGHRDTGI